VQQRYVLISILIGGISSQALAQDAGSLLRDKERGNGVTLPEPLPEAKAVRPKSLPPEQGERGETILIKQVLFKGKTSLLDDATRAKLAASIEGKKVGFSAVRALAEATNTALRQTGHLLAHALIPPQDATSGTLIVEISEGSLAEISLEYGQHTRIKRGIVAGIIDGRIDRQSLSKDDLESALLRASDLPGVTARSRLAPGQAAGTSRLIVDVSEKPVLSGSLHGDTFGSPSTGSAQGHAHIAISDVLGMGELTNLGFSYSKGQRYASAALAAPITTTGLAAFINYGFLDYQNVDTVGASAGLRGRAHYGSFGLQYQAIRSRTRNLRFSASLNGKALTDDSIAGRLADKRIVSGTLGFTGDVTDKILGGGVTQISASWTYGDLDLSRVSAAVFADALGLKTQGSFHHLNTDLLRLQHLPGAFSLLTRMSGQWASKNLDSSESFSLGGPYGVRGWPVGEGRGDMGLTGTMELRYDLNLKPNLGVLQLSSFVDAGHIWLNKQSNGIAPLNACGCNDYSLSSAGGGLSWRQRNFSLAGSWAHGLGVNPGRSAFLGTNVDGSNDRQQFWLSGSISF
jgi:hemolysin activation/secretion protein